MQLSLLRRASTPCLILSSTLFLAACAHVPDREPVTRNIPNPPSFLKTSPVPPATPGKNVFVVSQERADVIERQNAVIRRTYNAWITMKETYQKSFLKKSVFGR